MRARLSLCMCLGVLLLVCAAVGCLGAGKTPDASLALGNDQATRADTGEKDFLASLSADSPKERPKDEPAYVTAMGFVLKLGLVLVLAYGSILALKKFGGLKPGFGQGCRCIRVVENTPLGANRLLHLVEVGSRRFVVSSTTGHVGLIAELGADDLPETAVPEAGAAFRDQLGGFMSGVQEQAHASTSIASMLRESSAYLQDRVLEVGKLRGKLRDER